MYAKPQINGDTLIITLDGDVDHTAADQLRGEFLLLVRNAAICHIWVEMGRVSMMDSSGLALLLGWYRQVAARGGSLTLKGVSLSVGKVLRIGGLHKLMCVEAAS